MPNYASPMFQHRHYAAVAAVLAEAKREIQNKEPSEHINDLLDGVNYAQDCLRQMFRADNSRFDPARFDAAASGNPSNEKDRR